MSELIWPIVTAVVSILFGGGIFLYDRRKAKQLGRLELERDYYKKAMENANEAMRQVQLPDPGLDDLELRKD